MDFVINRVINKEVVNGSNWDFEVIVNSLKNCCIIDRV